jgi:hypothetical protein
VRESNQSTTQAPQTTKAPQPATTSSAKQETAPVPQTTKAPQPSIASPAKQETHTTKAPQTATTSSAKQEIAPVPQTAKAPHPAPTSSTTPAKPTPQQPTRPAASTVSKPGPVRPFGTTPTPFAVKAPPKPINTNTDVDWTTDSDQLASLKESMLDDVINMLMMVSMNYLCEGVMVTDSTQAATFFRLNADQTAVEHCKVANPSSFKKSSETVLENPEISTLVTV